MNNLGQAGPFIGRDKELAVLESIVDRAESGNGQIVMVSGSAGIGKSLLAEQLIETYAENDDVLTLWARCRSAAGSPPYWPWCQLVEQYVAKADHDDVAAAADGHIASLVNAFPELQQFASESDAPIIGLSPEESRFQLYNHFQSFLGAASKQSTILAVIDDFHWADEDSLKLLEYVAGEVGNHRLLIVVLVRDDLDDSEKLSFGEFLRERDATRMQLDRLDSSATIELVHALGISELSSDVAEAFETATGGNPFFIHDAVELLQSSNSSAGVSAMQLVSDAAKSSIDRRISAVSEEARVVLEVMAIAGRDIEASQLVLMCNADKPSDVLVWIDDATSAGVIEPNPSNTSQYRFTQALFSEAIHAGMSLASRTGMHANIGEVLESLFGNDAAAHSAELARHFFEARALIGGEKAIEYSMLAGATARKASALDQATKHLQNALDAKADYDDERADIEVQLAQAISGTEKRDLAADHFRSGFDHFVASGNNERAIEIASYPIFFGFGSSGLRDMLDQAIDLTKDGSSEWAYLVSRRARQVYHDDMNYGTAARSFEQALSVADKLEDAQLKLAVLADYGHVDGDELKYDAILERVPQAMSLLKSNDDTFSEFWTHHVAFESLFSTGWLSDAVEHADQTLTLSKVDGDRSRTARAYVQQHFVHHASGRLNESLDAVEVGLSPVGQNNSGLLGGGIVVASELGKYQLASQMAEKLMGIGLNSKGDPHGSSAVALAIPSLAISTADEGLLKKAKQAAQDVLSDVSAVPDWTLSAAAGLAIISVASGDDSEAEDLFKRLLPHSGEFVRPAVFSIDRILANLAALQKRNDIARAHFTIAIELCTQGGFVPELARTQADFAGFLIGLGDAADRELASDLIESVTVTVNQLKMVPLSVRVTALKEAFSTLPASRNSHPDGLTVREIEVLKVLATGKTNREIAEALFISQNTVIRHVSNIFSKTGSGNRVEASAYALRNSIDEISS